MISYNFDVLCSLFDSLSQLIRANISTYDNNFQCAHVESKKDPTFCSAIKDKIQKNCSASDAAGLALCIKEKKPVWYHCHFGYIEMMIPYNIELNVNIYISIGPFRDTSNSEEIEAKIIEMATKNGLDVEESLESFRLTPTFNEEKFDAIVKMVDLIIKYAKNEKLISVKDNFLENELNPYLIEHISENTLISEIASHFFYTNKQFENIVLQYSGLTPKKYILRFKMNYARQLLVSSNDSLQKISETVGFDDYNYFIKVFRLVFNDTPLSYRKKFATKSFIEM